MEDKPLVSIIVNCYNGEKYLRETIDSILNQTYHNYEVIFWDNQSTDSTASIIKSYKNERFNFYYAPKHTTLGEARNLALDKIKGQFLTFLDSDDVWERDFLERAVGVLSIYKNKFSFYYSNYYSWIDGEELVEYNTEKNSGNRTFKDLLSKYMVGMSAAVINVNSIIIADTKFEFGLDEDGNVVIGDEMLTPDSSRFWPLEGYKPGQGQPSFDKQFVRDWLKANPDNDLLLPDEVVTKTVDKYKEAYELLTGTPFSK